jgi:integrase/recombinase XerD
MNRGKITILFVINTAKSTQKELCPISCRITLNKERKQFSNGLFVNPNYCENKLKKVTIQEANHKYMNTQLKLI